MEAIRYNFVCLFHATEVPVPRPLCALVMQVPRVCIASFFFVFLSKLLQQICVYESRQIYLIPMTWVQLKWCVYSIVCSVCTLYLVHSASIYFIPCDVLVLLESEPTSISLYLMNFSPQNLNPYHCNPFDLLFLQRYLNL